MNLFPWKLALRPMILSVVFGMLLMPDANARAHASMLTTSSACAPPVSCASVAPAADEPVIVRAHPPGTLLREHDGRYWLVVAWPERALVPESLLTFIHPECAVHPSEEELACLPPRAAPVSLEELIGCGRLAEGVLVRTERGLYHVHAGLFYPFASETLARDMGYRPEHALETTEASLSHQGQRGFELQRALFFLCPIGVEWP